MKDVNDFRKLVCARIQSMPEGSMIAVGGRMMTKKEVLTHVWRYDKIGRMIIGANREYFDSLKSGWLKNIGVE